MVSLENFYNEMDDESLDPRLRNQRGPQKYVDPSQPVVVLSHDQSKRLVDEFMNTMRLKQTQAPAQQPGFLDTMIVELIRLKNLPGGQAGFAGLGPGQVPYPQNQ